MNLKNLVNKEIFKQKGYVTPELAGLIKLDANESPFDFKKPLQKKLLEAFGSVKLNRYPEAGAPLLRERFARYYGVDKDMIMLGNGSDELIQILCMTLNGKINGLLVPVPTFVMYKIIGINTGNKVVEVPLDENYDLDMDAMMRKIKPNFPAIIYLAYPNSPTGNCFNRDKIEAILKKSSGIVVVDEAYASFSGDTLLPLLAKYDNLVILKTLSKVGLAAMRLGFMIGNSDLLAEIDKVRLPYNVNSLSQVAAGFFLDYQEEFSRQIAEIVKRRGELYQGLKDIEGIRPFPSRANFIFFSCTFDSDRIYKQLVEKGIVVKNLNSALIPNSIRVTVGSFKENTAFLKALKSVVS
ncbi:MAG: histidinol-phosphate transaminase [Smithellaceae bacterium]